MESNIKGLVAAGHEMASELKAECGAVDMRSVAKLISDLATQLEVQLVRANALAAENAGLKSAHPQPFGPEMMKALDAYEKHQDEVPETGMLDAFSSCATASVLKPQPPTLFWLKYGRRAWRCWQKIIKVSSMHLRGILYFLMVNTGMQLSLPQQHLSPQSFAKEATSERKKND